MFVLPTSQLNATPCASPLPFLLLSRLMTMYIQSDIWYFLGTWFLTTEAMKVSLGSEFYNPDVVRTQHLVTVVKNNWAGMRLQRMRGEAYELTG